MDRNVAQHGRFSSPGAERFTSNDPYRQIIEMAGEAIWRIELDHPVSLLGSEQEQLDWLSRRGYLAECNDTMARLYGFNDHSEMHGLRLKELFPHSNPHHLDYLLALIRSGYRLSEYEVLHTDKKGLPLFSSWTALGEIENGCMRRIWGTTRDITERKKTEGGLQRYTETLEQRVAERTAKLEQTVQSLEGVCYHVAHDLRAPLRAMEGFTNILLQQYGPHLDQQGQDFARRISKAAERMDHLIGDLLDYGRLSHTRLPLGPVHLELQMAQVLGSLQEEIQRCGAIISISEPLGTVWANATVLDQMLTNLLCNAMKYVAPGVAPRIRAWTEHHDCFVRLWVEDNGIGIAPEHHDRVFRVFERLHRNEQYPGTGIGLAIVAKGAEIMGGRVGLESVEGQGSRFWVELKTRTTDVERCACGPREKEKGAEALIFFQDSAPRL